MFTWLATETLELVSLPIPDWVCWFWGDNIPFENNEYSQLMIEIFSASFPLWFWLAESSITTLKLAPFFFLGFHFTTIHSPCAMTSLGPSEDADVLSLVWFGTSIGGLLLPLKQSCCNSLLRAHSNHVLHTKYGDPRIPHCTNCHSS